MNAAYGKGLLVFFAVSIIISRRACSSASSALRNMRLTNLLGSSVSCRITAQPVEKPTGLASSIRATEKRTAIVGPNLPGPDLARLPRDSGGL